MSDVPEPVTAPASAAAVFSSAGAPASRSRVFSARAAAALPVVAAALALLVLLLCFGDAALCIESCLLAVAGGAVWGARLRAAHGAGAADRLLDEYDAAMLAGGARRAGEVALVALVRADVLRVEHTADKVYRRGAGLVEEDAPLYERVIAAMAPGMQVGEKIGELGEAFYEGRRRTARLQEAGHLVDAATQAHVALAALTAGLLGLAPAVVATALGHETPDALPVVLLLCVLVVGGTGASVRITPQGRAALARCGTAAGLKWRVARHGIEAAPGDVVEALRPLPDCSDCGC